MFFVFKPIKKSMGGGKNKKREKFTRDNHILHSHNPHNRHIHGCILARHQPPSFHSHNHNHVHIRRHNHHIHIHGCILARHQPLSFHSHNHVHIHHNLHIHILL